MMVVALNQFAVVQQILLIESAVKTFEIAFIAPQTQCHMALFFGAMRLQDFFKTDVFLKCNLVSFN